MLQFYLLFRTWSLTLKEENTLTMFVTLIDRNYK
jgi:hypothetical protein